MNIDWSKAPEGFDFHINWSDLSSGVDSGFYADKGDRFTRENGNYTLKASISEFPGLEVTKRPITTTEPQAYTGEGLPPLGATHYSEEVKDVYFAAYWKEDQGGCWAFVIDDLESPDWTFHECCEIPSRAKLFRTAEQIEKEEREVACRQLCIDAGSSGYTGRQMEVAYKLYDAGYRKQEQK
jgi:hypothetical protein